MNSHKKDPHNLSLQDYAEALRIQLEKSINSTLRRLANLDTLINGLIEGKEIIEGIPYAFFIEPTNQCNLKCPLCPTGSGLQSRRPGMMSMQLYESIISEVADRIFEVHFGFQGEPMLHPRLPEMVLFAHRHGLYTRLFSNFNVKGDQSYKKLVRAGLDRVTVSLDGASDESYSKYRVQGNLSSVLKHIAVLRNEREAIGLRRPEIEIQALALSSNEEELEEVASLAKSIGADVFKVKLPTLSSKAASSHISYLARARKLCMYDENGNLDQFPEQRNGPLVCRSLYLEPAIVCWDGRVSLCCRDINAEYMKQKVTIGSHSKDIWNTPFLQHMRREMASGEMSLPICKNCPSLGLANFIVNKRFFKNPAED